jgi:hydroxymethylbilane synthase
VLSPEVMLPAVGQGAIGVECRADDASILARLKAIDDLKTAACIGAERALLAALEGSCRTPIAGHASFAAGRLRLEALVARPDGSVCLRTNREGALGDGDRLGRDAGLELKARAGPDFFA